MEEDFCQERTQGRVSNPHGDESKVILLHAMKAYVGMEIQLHSFFTSALDNGGWSAERLNCCNPEKQPPNTH
jgi:hypothetical protein